MQLSDFIEQRLESTGITLAEFRGLLIRLVNYGVLERGGSQTEQELYDRFVRVEELIGETLALYGIVVHHDRRFEYARLYPPGSRTPGMEQAEDEAFGGSLRARLTQNEVAVILVLRAQYDKAVREAKIDENGFATESMEAIALAMKNWLNRGLPEKATERRRIFQRLRQLRLIDYRSDEELETSEAWLRIHPMIVDFVSTDAIDAASGAVGTGGAAVVGAIADGEGAGDGGDGTEAATARSRSHDVS
jgi:Domain of unknown function (DUF4194)